MGGVGRAIFILPRIMATQDGYLGTRAIYFPGKRKVALSSGIAGYSRVSFRSREKTANPNKSLILFKNFLTWKKRWISTKNCGGQSICAVGGGGL